MRCSGCVTPLFATPQRASELVRRLPLAPGARSRLQAIGGELKFPR